MAVGILVLHLAVQHVGDGLETPVRMVRCAHGFAGGVVHGAHLVQEQEGIEIHEHLGRERPVHDEAAALAGAGAGDDAGDLAYAGVAYPGSCILRPRVISKIWCAAYMTGNAREPSRRSSSMGTHACTDAPADTRASSSAACASHPGTRERPRMRVAPQPCDETNAVSGPALYRRSMERRIITDDGTLLPRTCRVGRLLPGGCLRPAATCTGEAADHSTRKACTETEETCAQTAVPQEPTRPAPDVQAATCALPAPRAAMKRQSGRRPLSWKAMAAST